MYYTCIWVQLAASWRTASYHWLVATHQPSASACLQAIFWWISIIYDPSLNMYINGDGFRLPMHRPDFAGNATHGFTPWGRMHWDPNSSVAQGCGTAAL